MGLYASEANQKHEPHLIIGLQMLGLVGLGTSEILFSIELNESIKPWAHDIYCAPCEFRYDWCAITFVTLIWFLFQMQKVGHPSILVNFVGLE